MTSITLCQCQEILTQATLNKYPELDRAALDEIVSGVWVSAAAASSEIDLMALLRTINNFEDDIFNEVVVLQLIERFWAFQHGMEHPLRRIHRALFGTLGQDSLRRSEYVPDYGGVVQTPAPEITARLDELDRLCSAFIVSLAPAPPVLKAFFLAYVFSSIIRVHPFADGNGRTARMFVQYALRSWRLPAMVIPKIRNDEAWKHALLRALGGDTYALQEQFLRRMIDKDSDTAVERSLSWKKNGKDD